MKRVWIVLTTALLAALLLATPGLAAAKGGSPQLFSLNGTILELDKVEVPLEEYIIVDVISGNRFAKQYIGDEDGLTVLVTGATKYWQCTYVEDKEEREGPQPLEYNDLDTGDAVFIQGVYTESEGEDIFTATKVIVDRLEP